MGKISSLLCRELHAQALLTTVIVHIISCALLWKFTLQTLAPCQVTQQPFIIVWEWKPEFWNCRMAVVTFASVCCPSFLKGRSKDQVLRQSRSASPKDAVYPAWWCPPVPGLGSAGLLMVLAGGQQLSDCVRTSLDLGFTSGSLAEAWAWRG